MDSDLATIKHPQLDDSAVSEQKYQTNQCQLCLSKDSLIEVLDLGHQPICNALPSKETLNEPEISYPLKLYVCKKCYLVQLVDVIPARTVFCTDYNYLSGTTPALVRYFQALAGKIVDTFDVKQTETVCDIGSNDGTFLRFFKEKHVNVLGVEPTPVPAQIATNNGVPTLQEFFTKEVSDRIVDDYGKMRVVTAMNVLAHNNDVHSFLEGVKNLMDSNSVFVSQSHYLSALVERLEYDTIYHEHLRYYSLKTLKKLFDMHGFHVFHAEINEVYGGSILTYCSLSETVPSKNVINILESETEYEKLETYVEYAKRVRKNGRDLVRMLLNLKDKGKRIVGVGAPMKASTLLNFCHIGPDVLEYVSEVNPLKIGKYTPGVHIPIVDEANFMDSQPDYALILSWNVSKDIIKKLRKKGYTGKFILHIPEPTIID
jgi:2-polyprenyl-3-methyl-5-hydroxy-6-metoxy-1,4-benzoquinol methylase